MIDHWDPTPSYQQLAAILRGHITSGRYAPGDQLPSEKQLTDESGLARETVRRAVKLLRDEGLVVTLPGRGTFVPPDTAKRSDVPAQMTREREPATREGEPVIREGEPDPAERPGHRPLTGT